MITEEEKRHLFDQMKEKEHRSLEHLALSIFGDAIYGTGLLDTIDSPDYDEAMTNLTEAMAMSIAIGQINARLMIEENSEAE